LSELLAVTDLGTHTTFFPTHFAATASPSSTHEKTPTTGLATNVGNRKKQSNAPSLSKKWETISIN